MLLKTLELQNWMLYRGKNRLELQPKAYAITARKSDNAERSNYLGKSAILEAIYFAVTGKLNPDRHMSADGWVTDGEKEGSVVLEFDDGTIIERARKKSTQLMVTHKGGLAKNAEGQAALDTIVGLTPEDMLATVYFQQRKMARLVLAENAERMGYVSAWLQLAPLEVGEERLREQVAMLAQNAEALSQHMAQANETETQESATPPEHLETLEKKLVEARGKHGRLQDLLERNGQLENAPRFVQEYDQLRDDIRGQEKALRAIDGERLKLAATHGHTKRTTAGELLALARRDLATKRNLALGQFDGHCPVAEIECPASGQINAQRKRGEGLRAASQKTFDEAEAAWRAVEDEQRGAESALREFELLTERLQTAQLRAAKMKPAAEEARNAPPPADPYELRERVRAASQAVADLTSQRDALLVSIQRRQQARAVQEKIGGQLALIEKKLATYREALVIFGKQGAQRRIAEGALATIQHGANAMLKERGIDLEVDVSWSREGAGLAKTCDACGQPFPSSAKVKACTRCNTPRGPLLVNKLDIILSEQSGAAEDLAGAAIQLAASSWLRTARGSRWSLALIDEPFGQCDRSNRQALASAFLAMLSGDYGFGQALITSHTPEIDMFPGRIEIVNDGTCSIARVVA